MIEKAEARLLGGIIFCSPGTSWLKGRFPYIYSVIFIVNTRLFAGQYMAVNSFGTAFHAITAIKHCFPIHQRLPGPSAAVENSC